MNWYLQVINKYAVFVGRARRREYWLFHLCNILIYLVCMAADYFLFAGPAEVATQFTPLGNGSISSFEMVQWSNFGMIAPFYGLFVLIPTFAVMVRRLHDTGRSGWWWLISLLPFVGIIILFVFLVEDSQPVENRYGANPKAPD
jgi:uncharacterized membrane protein YhaH (DUF805 family)